MKNILVLGAGKSATSLIEYLIKESAIQQWQLTVADGNIEAARSKINNAANARAVQLQAEDTTQRQQLIAAADIVISLLPPALHYIVAEDCLAFSKNLLTASYIDDRISLLQSRIAEKGILFLCETGLDPGIDHMSAMKLIHEIQGSGGHITAFRSHCGGLVAPESDNNPWHYKISWNPRNVVMAGKAGAIFKQDGEICRMNYQELFDANRVIDLEELGFLAWYPNRDSLGYMSLYGLDDADTFIRTTLRYPEFCFGWKNIVDLMLTDETVQYDTDGMTFQQFYEQHLNKYGFSDWVEKQFTARITQSKQLLEKLQELLKVEKEVDEEDRKALQEFMMIDDHGKLMDINLDTVKTQAAATVAGQMHEANLSMKQLVYLGMDDEKTLINKGRCSAADVLQLAIEQKLVLNDGDKDMIVMLHEIGYERNGRKHGTTSSLIVKGDDPVHTAMAKTVGLPLGIAAKLILQGKINVTGLHIPIIPEIYEPILEELKIHGIEFKETTV